MSLAAAAGGGGGGGTQKGKERGNEGKGKALPLAQGCRSLNSLARSESLFRVCVKEKVCVGGCTYFVNAVHGCHVSS